MIIKLKNNFCIDTDDLEDYAEFLVYDKGVSYYHGFFMAAFMVLCDNHAAITKNFITTYFNTRVYFEFWSQNSLPPLQRFEKFYYDAMMDTICFKMAIAGYSEIVTLSTIDISLIKFSGAGTRAKFFDFLENYKCLREQLELTY